MFTLRSITKTIISSFSGAIRTPPYRYVHRLLATNSEKFKISYNCGHGDSVLIGSTIGQALNKVSYDVGDQLAFVFCHQDVRRTFLETNEETDQLAASFLELGLRPGERLAVWSTNCYEWVLTQLAAAKAGLVLININPAFMPSELEYCLNKTSCKALIAGESFRKQDYFQQLCSVVPEIISSKPGQIKSSRGFHHTFRCTLIGGTSTMFVDIVNHPDVDKFDLTSLQAALIGGSPKFGRAVEGYRTEVRCNKPH
ncbi:medium-chain acyl-CoA ligase ACSF2, mitochondrial-like isoform X1 [Tachypleus tridentatus]|uniref:medium-chain acyl-CoA ligase ACSF2, mitochondrial-like isoform X1 n=1 Tax=Tachypleus tridentatus TaxID=6853 RepID=UPI003FD0F4C9